MTDYQRRITAAASRALGILEENALVPANATATDLIGDLTTVSTALDTVAAAQDLGFGTVHGSVVERRILKDRLHDMLVDLAETARVLDPIEHPSVGGEMRLGRATNSYATLLARARAFHAALVPAKAAFVAYGSPVTIDADLLAAITALEDATDRKNNGRASHIGGTANLAMRCRDAIKLLQKLDAIVSKVWKNDVGLLAAWKAARHVESAPRSASAGGEPVPGGSGSGSGSDPGSGI